MKKKIPFIHRLLSRLDRIDRESVQNYFLDLAETKSFYEEIFQELEEGIMVLGQESQILFINRSALKWFKQEPMPGKIQNLRDLPDSELLAFVLRHFPSLKERKTEEFHFHQKHVRLSMIPLEETTARALLLFHDTSAEKNVSALDAELMRGEALMKLTSGIAHEIGNPLNAISIHLQLLRKATEDLSESKQKTFTRTLDVLKTETERLDKIIKNFLKAARKPPLRFKLEDLNKILDDALHFIGPELTQNRIHLEINQDQTIPPFLIDRERLYQAFINLILNAMEAMPDGGNLKISTQNLNKVAVLKFKDSGTGISQEDLPRIYEPYYTTKKEGSGLGLMTVLNTVKEHNGKIEVATKTGKGSTFTLLLPIQRPNLQLPQYKTK